MARVSKIAETRMEQPELKETPMLTTDEHPIKVGDVLYRVTMTTKDRYSSSSRDEFEIEALRVFNVNNSARIFRTRCAQACEQTFKVGEGCSRSQVFFNFHSACAELHGRVNLTQKEIYIKRDAGDARIKELDKLHSRIKACKASMITIPKALS